MTESGFFQQKRASPSSLAIVIALHVGVLGAVILAKGPQFVRDDTRTTIFDIPNRPPPKEVEPPPPQPRDQRTRIDQPDVRIPLPPIPDNPPLPRDPFPTTDPNPAGTITIPDPPPVPVPDPVRRDASVDPRFAHLLQPPCPTSEQRAERTGSVRLRVTIGTDGRVKAVEMLSATSEAFWEVARQQALSRWRFRPATLDGRPVESTKVMTIQFRLADI
jgi:protein TonB